MKHTLHWSEGTDRDVRALAAHRGQTVGAMVEAALRSGLLYGFSLTVQSPEQRQGKPAVDLYCEPSAGERSEGGQVA